MPLAHYYKLNPKIMHIPINIKHHGKIFEKNMQNLHPYKKLIYREKENNFSGFDIFIRKINFFIKIICKRYFFLGLILKFGFLIFNFFPSRAKKKYQKYVNSQNFYSGEIENKTLSICRNLKLKYPKKNYKKFI